MQALPDLAPVFGSIRWALVDGMALRAYAPERMTLDVDVVIHECDAAAAREAFVNAGYEILGDLSIGGFSARPRAVRGGGAMEVDVIPRSDSWLDEALADPPHDPAGYPVLPRPYLTLLKLLAGRIHAKARRDARPGPRG